MNKVKVWSVGLLTAVLMVVSALEIFAQSTAEKTAITLRKVESQVALYTIHRGSYETTGAAVGKLFALAGQKGILPRGPALYVYLNNPNYVSKEHLLTEIRIPVSKEALSFAGTLGEMTDIKNLPATEFAVAIKPEGQADPAPIYEELCTWITEQGYLAIEGPAEKFLTNAEAGNYAQMKSEIMIPAKKAKADQK